ncbi:MAG TPA: phosphatase PAP2 family protein [Bacteroidetes bacterium]|nr:phosphatase PAP2 family protein [Bacteroidota bacterium]
MENTMDGNLRKIFSKYNPIDCITLLYIFLTTLLLIFGTGRYENTAEHYLVRSGMFIFIWLIVRLEEMFPGRMLRILHQLYPLLFLSYFYPETCYLHSIFPGVLDAGIIRLEVALFGFLPSEAFSRCCPQAWFSELMHFGYFSFYLIILFLVVWYYIKYPLLAGKKVFIFLFSFYIFYLIFIFFPSEGPQYFLPVPEKKVPAGCFFTGLMQKILLFDRPTGAFPSSHIGITWLIMFFFFSDNRKIFCWWLVPAVLLTFATVYIKAHYVVDVIAGFLMVPPLVWSGNKIYDLFFATHTVPGEEPAMIETL